MATKQYLETGPLGQGLYEERPNPMTVPPNTIGLWWSYDIGQLSLWTYKNVWMEDILNSLSIPRETLTEDRDLFIDTVNGNDSNDGLTRGTAFQSVQKADQVAHTYDCNGFSVTLRAIVGSTLGPLTVQGRLFCAAESSYEPYKLISDDGTLIDQITNGDAIKLEGAAYLLIDGIKTSTTAGDAWVCDDYSLLEHRNCQHGNVAGIMLAHHHYGEIRAVGPYSCMGDADSFVHGTTRGMTRFTGQTWGFDKVGGCHFDTYAYGLNDSTFDADSSTLTGAIAAGRTTIHLNSKINFGSIDRSGFTSNLLGPGPLIYGADAWINIDEWGELIFHVDPAGSDNNTGIGPEAHNALQTPAGALALLRSFPVDSATTNTLLNSALVICADATYPTFMCPDLPNFSSVKFIGNTVTPANVLILNAAGDAINVIARKTLYQFDSMRVSTTTQAGSHGLRVEQNCVALHSNMDWGPCTGAQKYTNTGGRLLNVGPTEVISGGATYHAEAESNSTINLASIACATAINGTPAFTAFLRGDDNSMILAKSGLASWTGTATGSRFTLTNGAHIDTAGGGAISIPGNAAGTCSSGASVDVGSSSNPIILAQSGVALSHTGDTTATNLLSVTVPANAVGANGQIEIEAFYSGTNSANNKTTTIKMGGSVIQTGTFTTQLGLKINIEVANRNATNSQVSASGYGNIGPTTTAINTTAAFNIQFFGTLALGTETITLESYRVVLYPKG